MSQPWTASDGLVVEDLVVRFGGLVAVDGITLAAPTGHLTGLIGPNGAGKTTTFDACSGLLVPTHGRVRLFGDDVTHLSPPARARLGMGRTFQRMELFDPMTVAENIAVGCEVRFARNALHQVFSTRRERHIVAETVERALSACGLTHLSGRTAGSLSTGQRRLLELARGIAGDFKLLLLDEPSSGLDPEETHHLGDTIRGMVEEHRIGVLLVEHDMSLVMSICEYIFVLDFGTLIFQGTPPEIQASPVVQAAYLGDEDLTVLTSLAAD